MKLSVLKRNQPIQEIDLGKDVLTHDYSETIFLIGRSKDCHIVLDDKKISREHVKVIHKNGKWSLEKTSEENVGLINGDNFRRHDIEDGDVLTIEAFSISFEDARPTDQSIETSATKESLAEIATAKTSAPAPSLKSANEEKPKPAPKTNVTSTDLNVPVFSEENNLKSLDADATGEIDISEFTSATETENESLENRGTDEFSNSTDEFEVTPEGESPVVEVDSVAQMDIGTENDIGLDTGEASSEGEDNAYSLENIDNTSDGDESTKLMQSFATVHLELFGETAPYDKFILEKDKTYIGRDPAKCQIILNDSEVSSVHAVITKNNIMVTLEDLGSSNGTILRGDRISKVMLSHNDEFVIGGVTFTLKIRSEFLKDESATLMAVDENQTVEVEEVVEVQAEEGEQFDALGEEVDEAPKEKSIIKRLLKDEQQRKKLIYGLVGLVLLWVMLDDGDKKPPAPVAVKKDQVKAKKVTEVANTSQKKLSEEQRRSLSALYEIGKDHFQNGRYREALSELQKVAAVDPNFNSSLQSLIALSKEGLSKIEEKEKQRQMELLAQEKKAKVKALLEKAREYTKDRRIELATSTFNDITQLEPENLEVTRMKLELEDWQKEKQRKELEEAQKKKDREDRVDKLKPGRTLYLQKEWFRAISKLEDFLKIKDMDDDLTTEATTMLKTSREELNNAVAPLLGKAKSLLEGQDLKGAYEVYQQVLRIEPSNAEALNQVGDIKEQLVTRARKIYREAIIAESLSLFQDAKEKFQEVQQISPVDSDYYRKATDKLKDYLE